MKISLTILTMFAAMISAVDVTELSNSTIMMGYAECYNVSINDSWQMFCAPSINTVNTNVVLTYGQIYNEPTTNITVTAPSYPQLNQYVELPMYNDQFYNSNLNLTVINKLNLVWNFNLTAGSSYTNGSSSISCQFPNYSINGTLDFGDKYTNNDVNIIMKCKDFPAINAFRELNFGEVLSPLTYDARYNLTVACKYLNLNEYLDINASKNALQVKYDEMLAKFNEKNATVVTLEAEKVTLLASQAELLANLSRPLILSSNLTCNTTQIKINDKNIVYCPEDVTTLCNSDEKLSGDFVTCINRLANDSVVKVESLTQQLTVCNNDKNRCENGEKTNQESQDRWTMIIVGFAAAIGGGWLLTEYLKHKRTMDSS